MVLPATLKDANGTPVSSVYINGMGWAVLGGSTHSQTDAFGTSSPALIELAYINGIAPLIDAAGQMTIEEFIQYQIMAGHGFQATTGLLSTGTNNAFICMQLAVNNISKKVLIFDIQVYNTNVMNDGRIYTAAVATADGTLTGLTAYNLQPKSANTSALTTLTGSPAATTQTSGFTGTQSAAYGSGGNTMTSLLTQKSILYFANTDTASVEIANKVPTSGNSAAITARWIEWT
jgi:hypothetical protein